MEYLVEILMFLAKCLVGYAFVGGAIYMGIDRFYKRKTEYILSLSNEIQKAFSAFQPKI